MSDDKILREQLEYYNARAQEYEETAYPHQEQQEDPCASDRDHILAAFDQLGTMNNTLELACGTGIWTQQLLRVSRHITAIDGAAEMLATTRAKLGDDPRVSYQQADLFAWHPDQSYDVVFFGFFLSHVPPDKVPAFLDSVAEAVLPGARVMIIDEHAAGRQVSGPTEGEIFQTRTLRDGSTYRIIKVYYDPKDIAAKLKERGFTDFNIFEGDCFFSLIATRT
jgi:2-polyprenyl-3-methyl-5-hydroxy-6-metoxy-1,4-benzoquinol methylase